MGSDDVLAGGQGVAVRALEANAACGRVLVENHGIGAEGSGGGVVADDEGVATGAAATVDPDAFQCGGIAGDDQGAAGATSADHKVIGGSSIRKGAGENAGDAVRHDLGVTVEGDVARDRVGIHADGAEAAVSSVNSAGQ